MSPNGVDHIVAKQHAANNVCEIEASVLCACFHCLKVFQPFEIRQWLFDEPTALCPFCMCDSVIGTASGFLLTPSFVQHMQWYWFYRQRDPASGLQ